MTYYILSVKILLSSFDFIYPKSYLIFCRHPIVLCGEPGMGKSSIMAKLVELAPHWNSSKNAIVLLRFLGLYQPHLTTHLLLTSLCLQLNSVLGGKKDFIPSDVSISRVLLLIRNKMLYSCGQFFNNLYLLAFVQGSHR